MTIYPRGARPNRWQSLHMVCKYRDHLKPVYPLRLLATATERGIGQKCASLKVLGIMPDVRLSVHDGLSRYDKWNDRQRFAKLPVHRSTNRGNFQGK